MAGKFLLLEEAALRLGLTVDDVHKLVDRKKLFPLRDGTTIKFKFDDIERVAAEAAEGSAVSGLTIDLDLDDGDKSASPAGGSVALADSISLADSVALPSGAAGGSGAIGGPGSKADGSDALALGLDLDDEVATPTAAPDGDLAQTMLGSGVAGGLDSMELDLDSIVGLSAASGLGQAAAAAQEPPSGSGTLAIDLSDVGLPGGSNATGSLAVGSDVDAAGLSGSLTNAGAALSGALDSGLSLEDGDAAVSGIDLGPLDDGETDEDAATMLGGDVFEPRLGGDDDDTGSGVIAEEPLSGESSFFGTGVDDESSGFTGDIPMAADVAAVAGGETAFGDVVPDTRFSVWQICGLVCCALLLLTGGFVMFDLLRTLGSPGDLTLSGPLLNPLAGVFGWRQ